MTPARKRTAPTADDYAAAAALVGELAARVRHLEAVHRDCVADAEQARRRLADAYGDVVEAVTDLRVLVRALSDDAGYDGPPADLAAAVADARALLDRRP